MQFQFTVIWLLIIQTGDARQLTPVILVPGDGGTRIEAKLNKPDRGPHHVCVKKTDGFETLWLNIPSFLVPWAIECFVDNFSLVYNRTSHKTNTPKGVETRVPLFGETGSVEWLNDKHLVGYYDYLVKYMVKLGYERGKTILGAPYDFRKAPNELGEFYMNFTRLVEETYKVNNNTKVAIVAHSLGNLVILYDLQRKSQEWKDKYIRTFITLGAPWGGSVKTVRMVASGYNIHIPSINTLLARKMQRSMPSSALLMPSVKFWNKSEVIVQTPDRIYTVEDYQQFYTDLNFTDGYLMRKDTELLVDPFQPPNVEVHCLYSYGLETDGKLIYTEDRWPDKQPTIIKTDGDSTVKTGSLEGCLSWQHRQKQPFFSKRFQGISHTGMLESKIVMNSLQNILMK